MLALQTIDLQLVSQIPSLKLDPACLLDDVVSQCCVPGHHESAINEKWQILDNPISGLIILEPAPLIRVEVEIHVLDLQVFAEKSGELRLSPEGVVPDDYWSVVLFNFYVGTHREGEYRVLYFIIFW